MTCRHVSGHNFQLPNTEHTHTHANVYAMQLISRHRFHRQPASLTLVVDADASAYISYDAKFPCGSDCQWSGWHLAFPKEYLNSATC